MGLQKVYTVGLIEVLIMKTTFRQFSVAELQYWNIKNEKIPTVSVILSGNYHKVIKRRGLASPMMYTTDLQINQLLEWSVVYITICLHI